MARRTSTGKPYPSKSAVPGKLYATNSSSGPGFLEYNVVAPGADPAILMETGDYLLMETGDHILLE